MNKQLQDHARKTLKEGLSQCSAFQRGLFNRMYNPDNLGKNINDVVDMLEEDKLDWAMQQVQRTLDNNKSPENVG